MNLLTATILANALFSFTTGSGSLLRPEAVASALGLATSHVVPWVGGGLVAYALLLAEVVRRRAPGVVVAACSLADFAWVVVTLALGIFMPTLFSPQGWLVMAAIAAIVAVFGVMQAKGLLARYGGANNGAGWLRIASHIPARTDPEALWLRVADLASIADHTHALTSATVDYHGSSKAVRTCSDRHGRRWIEHIQLDPPRRTMSVTFAAQAADFPFPFRELAGSWTVTSTTGGCVLEAVWEAKPKSPWLSFVTMPIFERLLHTTLTQTVMSMSQSVPDTVRGPTIAPSAGVR